jgi:cytochrome P450
VSQEAGVASVTSEPVPEDTRFDPFAPGFTDDPYPQYAALVARSPVQQLVFGPWAVFRYDDAVRLLRDPRLSVEDRSVAGPNVRAKLRAQLLGDRADRGTRQMLNVDPPDHTRLRGLVQQAFTRRRIEQLAPRVIQLVVTALDAMAAEGDGADLMAHLAFPLPFQVISEMLGMPAGDRDRLRELSHTLTLGLEPALALQHADAISAASDGMTEHVLDAIEWKRAHPADDLLSALIAAEVDGDRLTPAELVDQVTLLFVAGHETTVNLIGNGALALARDPNQRARLANRLVLIEHPVDELLRYDSPVQFSRRVTTSDVELDSQTIPAGSFVLVCLGSANRDAGRWGPDADRLVLGRPGATQHLAFGSGVHHCLGAGLARLEGELALTALVRRFPAYEVATDRPAWNGRLVLRGLDELPLHLE